MVATLSRNGTSYSLNDQRSYGAWGEIRTGASTGDPKGRYVANLGHKQDDESGLLYMRARYYEPSRGRFINEDPAMAGANWYVYCNDNPTNFVDKTGRSPLLLFGTLLLSGLAGYAGYSLGLAFGMQVIAAQVRRSEGNVMAAKSQSCLEAMMELHANGFRETLLLALAAAGSSTTGALFGLSSTALVANVGLAFYVGFMCGFMNALWEAAIIDIYYESYN